MRPATEADAALVRSWGEAFVKEAGVEGMTADFFTQLLRARKAYLWDDERAALPSRVDPSDAARERDRRPVHAARAGAAAATARRRRGAQRLLFGGGSSGCYLYADPENTAVSRIVGGIGYQRVQDQADIDFG